MSCRYPVLIVCVIFLGKCLNSQPQPSHAGRWSSQFNQVQNCRTGHLLQAMTKIIFYFSIHGHTPRHYVTKEFSFSSSTRKARYVAGRRRDSCWLQHFFFNGDNHGCHAAQSFAPHNTKSIYTNTYLDVINWNLEFSRSARNRCTQVLPTFFAPRVIVQKSRMFHPRFMASYWYPHKPIACSTIWRKWRHIWFGWVRYRAA